MSSVKQCNSEKLEYLPDVDGASWVKHSYKQVDGKWKIVVVNDENKDIDEQLLQMTYTIMMV